VQATEAANFAVTELAKSEPPKADGKLGKWKVPASLYLDCRAAFPQLDSQSLGSILQGVKKRYGKRRFEVHGLHKAALPTYRYPVPIPVPAKDAKLEKRDHRYLLTLRLAGKRYTLALRSKRRGRHSFARQLAALDRVLAGESLIGEVQVGRQNASGNDHRSAVSESVNGRKEYSRVVCRIAVWLPRQTKRERSGTMHLRTDRDAFWIAVVEGRDPWRLHADHVRRWVVRHRRQLNRLSDDTKFEKRWPKEQRESINGFRQRLCDRQNARLAEWCRQAAAMLANYADRQNVAEVVYDDRMRPSYEFPWSRIAERLSQLLDEKGIKLVRVGGSAEKKPDAGE